MDIGRTLYVSDRKAWRSWLAKNGKKSREIWLIYYKKASGRPRIPYNDAVEEALCYGWIDSIVKSVDGEKYVQRFSPRRPGSILSSANRERIRRLIANGKMTRAGLAAVTHAYAATEQKFAVADDILAAVRKDPAAWAQFRDLPESYLRVRAGYLEDQRKHSRAAFLRSLANFVRMTARGKRFGFIRD